MATLNTTINITPVTPAVGGVVEGLDLSKKLDAETITSLRTAWLDRGVLFFRGQDLSDQQLETFIGYFGKPITEPSNGALGNDPSRPPVHGGDTADYKAVTERWHADASWLA